MRDLKMLRLEINGTSTFSQIFAEMNKNKETFSWFNTVETLKIYNVLNVAQVQPIFSFVTNMTKLRMFKTRTAAEFNFLKYFKEVGHQIPGL